MTSEKTDRRAILQDVDVLGAPAAGVDRRAFMMRSAMIPANRRVDFDTTVTAMALTAMEMNRKYQETSEGGLAVSLVLC